VRIITVINNNTTLKHNLATTLHGTEITQPRGITTEWSYRVSMAHENRLMDVPFWYYYSDVQSEPIWSPHWSKTYNKTAQSPYSRKNAQYIRVDTKIYSVSQFRMVSNHLILYPAVGSICQITCRMKQRRNWNIAWLDWSGCCVVSFLLWWFS
jgi:hypothetical protein